MIAFKPVNPDRMVSHHLHLLAEAEGIEQMSDADIARLTPQARANVAAWLAEKRDQALAIIAAHEQKDAER